ncbi:MAG: primosomal protein N' [Gammaproteobacteria bacterium]|nr:primosomal protein N' [Gammaproteobacteria bacterium]
MGHAEKKQKNPLTILRIAVPVPLYSLFDYLPPKSDGAIDSGSCELQPGIRIRIPFGRSDHIGVLVEVCKNSVKPQYRLKEAIEILDQQPVISHDIFQLSRFAATYYHYPLGEVINSALPPLLRQGKEADYKNINHWKLTLTGLKVDIDELKQAPQQKIFLKLFQKHKQGLSAPQLSEVTQSWRRIINIFINNRWLEACKAPTVASSPKTKKFKESLLELNQNQQQAVQSVTESLSKFQTFLLDGVTGSGKTEVYFRIIEAVIQKNRQAMVLVPEIGLTPQLVERFKARFSVPLVVVHSEISNRERLNAWLQTKDGTAAIVIGTRSALFLPLHAPGVFIIDEEHDISFKQQEGFRYHARDVAVMRASQANVPIILGSATPSLESLRNVFLGRYQSLKLTKRAGSAQKPTIKLLDIRNRAMESNLSLSLLKAIRHHLEAGNQVLLFLNRRGYAPSVICHTCGWVAECRRCDATMTFHQNRLKLCCHHCGSQHRMPTNCPKCQETKLISRGYGTERVEQILKQHFPDYGIERIDRDSTSRKGAMEQCLKNIHEGHSQLLVGTQMLAKGHHFPNVTLVGIIDADQGLFGVDFRASERMAQLIIQVTGRAGREEKPGEVLIQTHHPDHPLLQALIQQGYHEFSKLVMQERFTAELPPYCSMALLRAEATNSKLPSLFLEQATELIDSSEHQNILIFGPVPAPMERRAGRFRAQLILQSVERVDLHRLLKIWIPKLEKLKTARKVRWSLDVDPMDMI